MKKIFSVLIILVSASANAKLIGQIAGDSGALYIDVLDFQAPNTVNLRLMVEGEEDLNDRVLSVMMNIDLYNTLFNSDDYVETSIDGQNFDYSYHGETVNGGIRKISIVLTYGEGPTMIDLRVATITIDGDKASIELMKTSRENAASELEDDFYGMANELDVKRTGICLYGDNRGWPEARVTSFSALQKAAVRPTPSTWISLSESKEFADYVTLADDLSGDDSCHNNEF